MRLLLIKHGIYELTHELLNNLKNIMKLGNCPNPIESPLTTQPSTPTKPNPPPPKKRKGHKNAPPPKQQNRTSPPMAHKTPRPNRQTQTNAPEEKTTKRYSMSPPRRKPNNPTAPQTHPKTEIHSTHGSISLNKKKRSKTYRKTDYKKLKITSQKQPSYVFCEKSCF